MQLTADVLGVVFQRASYKEKRCHGAFGCMTQYDPSFHETTSIRLFKTVSKNLVQNIFGKYGIN